MKTDFLNAHFGLLLFAAMCVLMMDKVGGSAISEPQIREKRTVGRSRHNQGPSFSQQLSDVLESLSPDSDLSQHTPTTPRPQDVNCYVEIPTTTVVGGRCVSMGGQSYMCQAGAYLAFTSQCLNGNLARRGSRGSAFQMFRGRRNG